MLISFSSFQVKTSSLGSKKLYNKKLSTVPMYKKAAETYTKIREKITLLSSRITLQCIGPSQGLRCTAPLHQAGSLEEKTLPAVQKASVHTHSMTHKHTCLNSEVVKEATRLPWSHLNSLILTNSNVRTNLHTQLTLTLTALELYGISYTLLTYRVAKTPRIHNTH